MRVLYDPQTFMRQRAGGISRLFTDLIVEFDRDLALGVEPEVPFTWTDSGSGALMEGELTLKRGDFGIGLGDWKSTDVIGAEVKLKFRVKLRKG